MRFLAITMAAILVATPTLTASTSASAQRKPAPKAKTFHHHRPSSVADLLDARAEVLAAATTTKPGTAASAAIPTPPPAPTAATAKPKISVAAAKADPLVVLQNFTVADLQAALADAQAQAPPDAVAVTCYNALIPLVSSSVNSSPLPSGLGVQLFQRSRNAKSFAANLQSASGPLAGLNVACAPLVLSAENTLVALGVAIGAVGEAAAAGGGTAVVPLLPLPKP